MKNILITIVCLGAWCLLVAKNGNGIGNEKETDCAYASYSADSGSGTFVKTMEREILLNYFSLNNSEENKPGVDAPVIVYANISNFNNDYVLFLKIEILSEQAADDFGAIYMGDKLLLKLNTNEIISLESGKSEYGVAHNSITSYTVFFPIQQEQLELFKSGEVVKIRIHWSKGYMDYAVDNRDFFMRQINCVSR